MRYYVVLDIPDDVYPATDPFYAPGDPDDGLDGPGTRDPLGLGSLATWIDAALGDEHPVESTTYATFADLAAQHDTEGDTDD